MHPGKARWKITGDWFIVLLIRGWSDMEIPHDPELTEKLQKGVFHEGVDTLGGFAFRLDFSVPYIVTAIHAGGRVRDELQALMYISAKERAYEDDIATDRIVQGHPNTIWGLDSRSEYDLNRPPETALPLAPEMFWGVTVYEKQPTPDMNRRTLEKYNAFYLFIGSCVKILLERFGTCVVYDMHSYNIDRQVAKGFASPPVFNLGTEQLDRLKWKTPIDGWLQQLRRVDIPGIQTTVAENGVFSGRGEFCRRLTGWDPNILVLPTEISKIYMDEREGVVYDPVISSLRKGLQSAITTHARPISEPQ
jgi:hypothetical protein